MNINEDNILDRLSSNGKLSLKYAQKIAQELFATEIKPMHIFFGILLNKESLGSRTLIAMGVDVESTLTSFVGKVRFNFENVKVNKKSELKFSNESKDIIQAAYALASNLAHVYVGTEHILLALLAQKESEFVKAINGAGLNEEIFRENLVNFAVYPPGVLAKPEDNNGQSKESPLTFLGHDLVDDAKEGLLDPLVGRDEELDQIINVLSRRRKNNPVIVGEPGVGKTAIVEGLAQMISLGTVPTSLQRMRVIALDVAAIMAGSKLRGDVEEKMISIIEEVTSTSDIILFIDEIHNILGTNFPGGGLDIASILKPALVRDDFRVIGATTSAEYTKYFEEDNALVRRFQPIYIEEPSVEETIEILHKVEPILETHHNIEIKAEAIEAAATLSDRYVTDRFLPDKAIDLLDEAAASKRLELEVKYSDVSDLIKKKQEAINKKNDAVLLGKMKEAQKWSDAEKKIDDEISAIDRKISRSRKSKAYNVDADVVRAIVSKWTGIPVETVGSKESSALLNLDKTLSAKVIGQKEAVQTVASAIKRARAGISTGDRPWASFLFLGPTGVGKSELAKVLTHTIFGDEDRLIQIDMSELMEMHSISKLIGSPPGYIGYREGGQLTEMVRKNPHSVILFDEIEKAHPDVLNILLQIMEYGHLTDGKGKKVNFKNTVVILTSNIGAEEIRKDKVLGFSSESVEKTPSDGEMENAYATMKDDLMRELKDTLRPELLNRIDDIVIFRSLTRKDAKQIVDILIDELNSRIAERGVQLEIDNSVRSHIASEGFSEEYGARPLRRVLQDLVENALAEFVLKNRAKIDNAKLSRLYATMKGDEILVNFK
ncbi:MAG: ATP-dependent Clp protease ATP-binding subunit [Candidatus Dojkabacteria bacterium]